LEPTGRFDLTDRIALVTGGSRGIGRSIAFGLAKAGAEVIIVSRNLEQCEQTAAELREAVGVRASAYACHVGRWGEIDRLVEDVYAEKGHLEVLVNNAGMAPTYPSLAEVSEDLFDKVIGVNLKGPFRLATLIGSRMASTDGGSIINIGSTASLLADPDTLPYSIAKAGLNTLTLGIARAFGPRVRCNGIMLGRFGTDMSRSWNMEDLQPEIMATALQRVGKPDEIAETALYLASDASSYTTGAVLKVDGGIVA